MIKLKKNIIKAYRYVLSTHRWSLMYKGINDENYIDIRQPKDLSRADSFSIEFDNKIYIFFEEWVTGLNAKGHLSVGELDIDKNELINVRKILEKKYHLSYPFTFKYKNEWYLVPETHQNNSIDLYKFIEFPYKLEKVKTLIGNINAADTTLIIKDNVTYLFTNIKEGKKSHSDNLSLFYSDDLLNSAFKKHPMNPLKIDNRYARMAGRFVKEDGTLYRYAQDCSISYGDCMYKFEIIKLTKSDYKEKMTEVIHKPNGCVSSHTFSKVDNFVVIDVIYRVRNMTQVLRNVVNLFKVIFK